MLNQIANEKKLKAYMTHTIADSGLTIAVDDTLNTDAYIAVKVDDYYNGLHLQGETPKAVDFIVSVDCHCDAYILYVLELKGTKKVSYTTVSIHEKFDTAIHRFMGEDFSHIYQNDKYKYKSIFLYVVSKAYASAAGTENYSELKKLMDRIGKKDTLNRDRAMSEKEFVFRGQRLRIQKEFPPNPIIRRM